jgi:hypothetical protein
MEIGGDPRRWLAALGIFCFGEEKRKDYHRGHRGATEYAERGKDWIRTRDLAALDRKNPRIAKDAKGGHPQVCL